MVRSTKQPRTPEQVERDAAVRFLAEAEERLRDCRAENERLRAREETAKAMIEGIRKKIERLKAYEQMWHEQYASDLVQARAENERLRATNASLWLSVENLRSLLAQRNTC